MSAGRMRVAFVFLILLFVLAAKKGACDNVTEKYVIAGDRRSFESRQHRLLTFDTKDNGEIEVELAFHLPFVTIPIKKSLEMGKGMLANVDLNAILLGGGLVLALGVVLPAIFMYLSYKTSTLPPIGSYRSGDDRPGWRRVLATIDETLIENDIDAASCARELLCWTVKTSKGSMVNIVEGLTASEWLRWIVEGTAVGKAIENGLSGKDCAKKDSACRLTQKNLQMLQKQLVNIITL